MKPVYIKKAKDTGNQSKAYARYEKLLSEIEKQQQFKTNITDGLRKAHSKINEEFSPLEKEVHLLNRDYLIRLDELATEIGLGKYNREWFEGYMSDELELLLDFFGHQDKVLSDLLEKYSGLTVNELSEDEDLKELVEALQDKFGFEVNVEELLQKGERAYFEDHRQEINNEFEADDSFWADSENEPDNSNERKKAKSLKSEEEDSVLAKDARNIYMRLIKKFHPDLEKDAVIRDEKNEIVKQVTKAYQEKDFFSLLKLQITYLDDNEAEAVKIADDMIKRYNKILQKQLDDINAHLFQLRYAGGAIIDDLIDKNGKFSTQKFNAKKRAIEKTLSQLKVILTGSKKRPKGWFKEQVGFIKQTAQQNMMEDIFENMFDDFNY
ncbi:MAG: hypothetical protein M3O71_31060 [Bacteroidota bacterium]|nr:hypothetical protein [Bacteroidota bacterium]